MIAFLIAAAIACSKSSSPAVHADLRHPVRVFDRKDALIAQLDADDRLVDRDGNVVGSFDATVVSL